MKRDLTHLAGIVFLIAVLATGSFNPAKAQPTKKVTIYVKAVEIDGEKHLEMYDEDDEGKVGNTVIDNDTTGVDPGTEVVWRRAPNSGIRRFIRVSPEKLGGLIFPQAATTILFNKRFRHYVPSYAPVPNDKGESIIEKYIIEVLDTDGNIWYIDPYLELPDPD